MAHTSKTQMKTQKIDTSAQIDAPCLVPPKEWPLLLSYFEDCVSVASFNTLHRNSKFKDRPWVTEQEGDWNTRSVVYQDLLPFIGTDFLCLQETELTTFDQDFGFMVEKFGYDALKLPHVKDDHSFTKPAILFKREKFVIKWVNPRTRTILAFFEHRATGKHFYLINCHLQSGRNQDDQRCFQMRSALQQLLLHANSIKLPENEITCILCGDLNSSNDEAVHKLITEGKVSPQDVQKHFNNKKPFPFTHPIPFKDSHFFLKDNRPFTFKWGVKETSTFSTLDYVYYSSNHVDVVHVRDPLSSAQRKALRDEAGLPNQWHPSDHLPVATLFKFR